jgi:hypothetical protein
VGDRQFRLVVRARKDRYTVPETRNLKPGTRNPNPETRHPKSNKDRYTVPETRNLKPGTRNPNPETRNPTPEIRQGSLYGTFQNRNPKSETGSLYGTETQNPKPPEFETPNLLIDSEFRTANPKPWKLYPALFALHSYSVQNPDLEAQSPVP